MPQDDADRIYEDHKVTWDHFTSLTKWSAIAIAAVLILMALFLL